MRAEKSEVWKDKVHLQSFSGDGEPPIKLCVFGDIVELQNWDYTITQMEQLIATLQTAVSVAKCYNYSFVPF